MCYKNKSEMLTHSKEYYYSHLAEVQERHRQYYYKNKEQIKMVRKIYTDTDQFRLKTKLNQRKYRIENKLRLVELRKRNRLKLTLLNKKYYAQNKLKVRLKNKKYYLKNKKKVNQRYVVRYHTDNLFKLNKLIAKHIKQYMKKNNLSKSRTQTKQLLGWGSSDLKKHLEKQFSSEMSISNHGKVWHIDHVVPISWFKTPEQVIKKGWALSNLQPLEIKLNLEKNNDYVGNPKTNLPVIYL